MTDQTEREKNAYIKWQQEEFGVAKSTAIGNWDASAHSALAWQARAALDGGAVSQDAGAVPREAFALEKIITAAEHAYDTLYQHGDFHHADELSKAIVIARREVPLFASLDNSLPLETPTDKLVSDFAVALKSKLNSAREKYGHEDEAWRDSGWLPELLEQLETHLAKGDPRDVAAYCAFAWYHNWSLAALRTPPATDGGAVSGDVPAHVKAWREQYGNPMANYCLEGIPNQAADAININWRNVASVRLKEISVLRAEVAALRTPPAQDDAEMLIAFLDFYKATNHHGESREIIVRNFLAAFRVNKKGQPS